MSASSGQKPLDDLFQEDIQRHPLVVAIKRRDAQAVRFFKNILSLFYFVEIVFCRID